MWAHFSLSPRFVKTNAKPTGIEVVAACLVSHLYVICVYVPPDVSATSSSRDDILLFLVDFVDKTMFMNPKSEIIVCGRF